MTTVDELFISFTEHGILGTKRPSPEYQGFDAYELDLPRMYLFPELVTRAAGVAAEIIGTRLCPDGTQADLIVSPEGAAPMFGSRIVETLNARNSERIGRGHDRARFIMAERNDKGAMRIDRAFADEFSNGIPVVVVTDITDRGRTLATAAEDVRKVEGNVIGALTIFKRRPADKMRPRTHVMNFRAIFDEFLVVPTGKRR